MKKTFDEIWEDLHKNKEWGRYPSEEIIRFVARNYYNQERDKVKILDFGCGAGANTWFLAREGFDTYAFDGSKTAVNKAKSYLKKENLNAKFQVADALEVSYPENYFDCIIDGFVISLSTLSNIISIYQKVYKLLLPGGGEVRQYEVLLEGVRTSAENLEGEQEALTRRLTDNRLQQQTVRQEIGTHEAEAASLRESAREKLAGQTDLQTYSNQLSGEMSQRKEQLAGLRAQRTAGAEALERMEQTRRDLAGDREQRLARMEAYREEIASGEAETARRTEESASLRLQAQERQEALKSLQEARLRLEQERTAMGQKLKESNDALLEAEREAGRLEQKLNTGGMEEKQILDRLWESYELSHSAAMEQRIELESTAKAARRVTELKREISGLGTVNVGAIEEFQRVNERYTYLTGQRDDVEQAKGELEGIIEAITKEMTAIFAQQFELIAASFRETYLQLFGGGRATLELEDPADILNCGIEIKVQPPGKTLKTLSLLSGGEKAFVAIALYFAILKVHPTPFFVMDEVEAALDEANVVRVARYMRSISDKTQFIVITHRRGTMEEADVLYGVTMQEKGVSRMLAINMNEMAEELDIQ